MYKLLSIILLTIFSLDLNAQESSDLESYLNDNKYPIKQNDDMTTAFVDDGLPNRLNTLMRDKVLLVYGEGFSHNLILNGHLENMLIDHFGPRGLKYVFGEQARSWIIKDDLYMNDPNADYEKFYPERNAEVRAMWEHYKRIYNKYHFECKATDFERKWAFKQAIELLMDRVEANNRMELEALLPYIKDTTYMAISPAKFVKFLEEQRGNFYRDSSRIKLLAGNMYSGFRYLLTDPEPSQYTDNRNRNMANHVIWQMGRPEAGTVYIQTCGLAHARRKGDVLQKSMVGYMEATDELKGRLLTLGLYCENCTPEPNQYGIGDNSSFRYIKDEVLMSFQQAAGNEQIVLFDLTKLPEKYQYLRKDNVDLLIFSKNAR